MFHGEPAKEWVHRHPATEARGAPEKPPLLHGNYPSRRPGEAHPGTDRIHREENKERKILFMEIVFI